MFFNKKLKRELKSIEDCLEKYRDMICVYENLNEELTKEVKSLKNFCQQQYSSIYTVNENNKIIKSVLENIIKNKDSNNNVMFNDVESLSLYIQGLIDVNINYINRRI